jgi:hypothetical protein
MENQSQQQRVRAVSMELAAYLDDRYVEMHIVTDTGKTIAVACDADSIFAIQRHIEQMGRECPEIASWARPLEADSHGRPMAPGAEAIISREH